MKIVHPVPWFPAWGVKFNNPISDLDSLVAKFNQFRENNRWALLAGEIVASELHLWTSWYALRRREARNKMIARSPDIEILRLMSGTHQIKTAFQRAGIKEGDVHAWVIYIPEGGGTVNFGDMHIERQIYSDKDNEARKLTELIGAKIIPKRPIPLIDGLKKIGIEGNFTELNFSQIEDLFLTHMSLSDL